MLHPEIIVDLLAQFRVRVDFVRRAGWLVKSFRSFVRRYVYSTAPVNAPPEANKFHNPITLLL